MKHLLVFVWLCGLLMMNPEQALACGFDGNIEWGDGSKATGIRITSSWNSERAQFPRPGYYFLELGPNACGRKIELFVNGDSMGRYNIPNRGMATVPVRMKGNRPVR